MKLPLFITNYLAARREKRQAVRAARAAAKAEAVKRKAAEIAAKVSQSAAKLEALTSSFAPLGFAAVTYHTYSETAFTTSTIIVHVKSGRLHTVTMYHGGGFTIAAVK